MAFIQIGANQGITQAIAEKLNIKGKKFTPDIWNQVVGLVEAESQTKNIFDKKSGTDISGDGHSNYVVQEGIIEVSDTTWNRICKLLKAENNSKATDVGVQDKNPSITKTTNLAKAFNLITKGIKENKLGELPDGFRNAIIQAYGSIDTAEDTPTVAEYVTSLLIEAQKILGKTDKINQDMVQRALGGAVTLIPDDDLYGRQCSDYSDKSVVESFMKANNIEAVQTIQNVTEVIPPSVELQNTVKEISDKLILYLESTDIEFDAPDGSKIKGSELAKYIKNIDYETNPMGAARADLQNGKILVNTHSEVNDKTDFAKVLIHEALHCVFKTVQDTQKEERLCEEQAVRTTARLVKENKLEGSKFRSLNYIDIANGEKDTELKNELDNWINQYYSSRPTDLSGKVTINGQVIEPGDEVFINGQKQGVIGNSNFYLDSPDGKNVLLQNITGCTTTLSNNDNGHGKLEIMHEGKPIYKAYIK